MFIERFNELCEESKISRLKLSQIIGIADSTMYGWDKGQQPTADKIIKIADFFEVSTDYLLGRSNDIGLIEVNKNLLPDEAELLEIYKKLNYQNKNQVLGFIKALAY